MAETASFKRRAAHIELRVAGRRLEGYAATYGTEARIADFTETIAPGAFAAALHTGADILALVDHDPAQFLARARSGTLRLASGQQGPCLRSRRAGHAARP